MSRARQRTVAEEAAKVVTNNLCTGCGACTLLDRRLVMRLDSAGYMRPELGPGPEPDRGQERLQVTRFDRVCPGRGVQARAEGDIWHPVFGRAVAVWEAHATAADIRDIGSSGGVLTALTTWLQASRQTTRVAAIVSDADDPTRSKPTTESTPEGLKATAGSRYAPSPTLANPDVLSDDSVVVAKPCEAAALRGLVADRDDADRPLVLSFFCAGVPSQRATDTLVEDLGMSSTELVALRYRGDGCPGTFKVVNAAGESAEMSYEESWGTRLGPTTQWRCKLCPDGTGDSADIAVGDYWPSDENGYPVFDDSAGTSVAIARTVRGEKVLREAAAAGVIHVSPLDLDALTSVQPLQVDRRTTVASRALGARLAGRPAPHYQGFRLHQMVLRHPWQNFKAGGGAYKRGLRQRREAANASPKRRA